MNKYTRFLSIALTAAMLLLLGTQTGFGQVERLQTVFDKLFGADVIDVISDELGLETFNTGCNETTLLIEQASFADGNSFGWYPISDPSSLNEIFSGEDSSGAVVIANIPPGPFGLYMGSAQGHILRSETALNDDGFDHFKTYNLPDVPQGFVIGIEDLYGGGDADFEDMVVSLRPSCDLECGLTEGNVVGNFCFEDGRLPWKFWHSERDGWFAVSSTDPFAGARAAKVKVHSATKNSNIQLYQDGIALEPNTTYALSFAAYSNRGQDMKVYVHKHGAPYTNYGLRGARVNLEREWQQYSMTFTTPNRSDMDDARLRFWFAPYADANTVYNIDRVVLRPMESNSVQASSVLSSNGYISIDADDSELLAGGEVPEVSLTGEQTQIYLPILQ